MRQKLINLFKDKGFLITLGSSLLVLCIFFGKPLFHANTTYFGVDGDGIQAYYTSAYHAKYDTSYLYFKGSNYPYGENVFFTGCQPVVTGILKLFGLSGITIGVTNLLMLFSIVFSSLFIYLILKELEVTYWYAALSAVAIAYFSPQMIRLFAHYTLALQFAIPAFIYALMRFYKAPGFKKSVVVACFTFYMASTHLYFFGFYVVISGFYWLFLFLLRKENFKNVFFCLKHFSIQIIIPYVILQLIILSVNNVTDRTNAPWGILEYKTSWTGVFYPSERYYEVIPKALGIIPQPIETAEGHMFAGLLATVFFIFIVLRFVFYILTLKIRKAFCFTGNLLLDIFLWSSIVALLYSFGYPFVFDHEEWLNHLGVLRQMRGIARFAWIFYYVMNIAAVYLCYQAVKNVKVKAVQYGVLSLAVAILILDLSYSIGMYNDTLNNKLPELSDKHNVKWQNHIFKTFDPNKFQAMIALPYFHVGSENYGYDPEPKTALYAYMFSLKTGLPMMCNVSSRTSLSQTLKNLAVAQEKTSEPLKILKDFKNKKPFLLLVNPDKVHDYERELISVATPFSYYTNGIQLYSLSVDALEKLTHTYEKYLNEMNTQKLYPNQEFMTTDSILNFMHKGYDDPATKIKCKGQGAFYGFFNNYNVLIDDTIPNPMEETKYLASFLMYNYQRDEYPRTNIAFEVLDKDNKCINCFWTACNNHFRCMMGKWGLVEAEFMVPKGAKKLKLSVFNFHMVHKTDSLIVDELLVRPAGNNIYQKQDGFIYKNNRFHYKDQ